MTEDGLFSWGRKCPQRWPNKRAVGPVLVATPATWLLSNYLPPTGTGTVDNAGLGRYNYASVLESAVLAQSITAFRLGMFFAAAGAIALIIVLVLWTRGNAARKQAEHDQDKQILDPDGDGKSRYTEAMKQLGDDSSTVRLGGIHALERLAQNSVHYRQTILDVLWSYLRTESPLQTKLGADRAGMKSDAAAAAVTAGQITQLSPPTKLTILSGVNLTGAMLSGAVLDGGDLTDADLTDAHLIKASFDGANLDGASFIAATVNDASFTDADLTGANFTAATLAGASFMGADLTGVSFSGADLTGTYFLDANLTGANFTGARLTGAKFTRANLSGTYSVEMTGRTPIKTPVTRKYLKHKGAKSFQSAKGLPREKN